MYDNNGSLKYNTHTLHNRAIVANPTLGTIMLQSGNRFVFLTTLCFIASLCVKSFCTLCCLETCF